MNLALARLLWVCCFVFAVGAAAHAPSLGKVLVARGGSMCCHPERCSYGTKNHLLPKAMQYESGKERGEAGTFKCCRLDAEMLWHRFSKPI